MDGVGDNAPNGEIVVGGNLYLWESGIVRYEPCTCARGVELELFDRVFAVDIRHDEVAILRLKAAVDDDKVAVENACVTHRIAVDMGIESGLGIGREAAGEVDTLARMVGCRRRETCMDRFGKLEGEFGGFGGLGKVGQVGHGGGSEYFYFSSIIGTVL